jgi:hypothetical protein
MPATATAEHQRGRPLSWYRRRDAAELGTNTATVIRVAEWWKQKRLDKQVRFDLCYRRCVLDDGAARRCGSRECSQECGSTPIG